MSLNSAASQKIFIAKPIESFDDWLSMLSKPSILLELASFLVCVFLAWASVVALRKKLGNTNPQSILFGRNVLDGVMFPLLLFVFSLVVFEVQQHYQLVAVLPIGIPAILSLLVIRVVAKALQFIFPRSPWVPVMESTISWIVWLVMLMWVTGLMPIVLNALDGVSWKMGGSRISLLTLLEGLLTSLAVLIISLWISAWLESKLLRSATGNQLSLRMALSEVLRVVFMLIGLILALSAVGIDLTTLSVLGGAVGLGIGFGLQKLIAQYISGFVILAERSMRIGDMVRVDGFEGRITQINARFTVVRSLGGLESVMPNDLLLGSRFENLTLADPRVYQSTSVIVGHDVEAAFVCTVLREAALAQQRVLHEPANYAPVAMMSNFLLDGLEFKLGYWVTDPENNMENLRSDINIAILTALRNSKIPVARALNATINTASA